MTPHAPESAPGFTAPARPAGHRHTASFRHGVSCGWPLGLGTTAGLEHGTCECGARIMRVIVEGETPARNRREWVTQLVSIVKADR